MGYNTTVVILNDALSDIEHDGDFGENLVKAIMQRGLGDRAPITVYAGRPMGHSISDAARVVESHHSSGWSIVAVGGNTGEVLGYYSGDRLDKEAVLKDLADQMGYSLRKKPSRTKTTQG